MSFTSDVKAEVRGRVALNKNFPEVIKVQNFELVLSIMFLEYGSVTDPNKSYRLEYVFDKDETERAKYAYKFFTNPMFSEFLGFELKHTSRGGKEVFYTTKNEDFFNVLTIIGANEAAVTYTNVFIEKNLITRCQRQVNCEMGNISKMSEASKEQLKYIEKIRKTSGLETLPERLYEIAVLRIENPDISLTELGKLCNPVLSRSGVNHRLQKIVELGKNLCSS
jgi:DNA-binding protein WhiA